MDQASSASPWASIANWTRRICWVTVFGWSRGKRFHAQKSLRDHASELITPKSGSTNPGAFGFATILLSAEGSSEKTISSFNACGQMMADLGHDERLHTFAPGETQPDCATLTFNL